MKKIILLIFLTACGDSSSAWDGEWQGIGEGADNLDIKIESFEDALKGQKNIILYENRRIVESCIMDNSQEIEVEMKCKEAGNFTMMLKDDKITVTIDDDGEQEDDGKQFTFVKVDL